MKKKNIKKLRYLDSKGKLYSNGIKVEQNDNYNHIDISKNYNLIENYNELQNLSKEADEQCDFLKKELNLLQKNKDLLQWYISNNVKRLSMKRSEQKFKEESRAKLEEKVKALKDKTKISKFECEALEEEVNKMKNELKTKMYIKNDIEIIFNELIEKKDDYLKDLTEERKKSLKDRKKRQNQLKKLLLLTKQENNKNYNVDYLQKYENNLMNELVNYKNYKKFETKLAMDTIKIGS